MSDAVDAVKASGAFGPGGGIRVITIGVLHNRLYIYAHLIILIAIYCQSNAAPHGRIK